MEITNCKDPDLVSYLAPWFVPTEKSIVDICVELKDRLVNKPEETLCLVFSEKQIPQAVVVAYKVDDYVWIWQARAKKGFKYSHTCFELLKKWAKFVGVKALRLKASKKSSRRHFKRKYKFQSLNNKEMVYYV